MSFKIDLSEVYEKGFENMKARLQRRMQGFNDSGRTSNSIQNEGDKLTMAGNIATLFDGVGRRPGTWPPIDAIMRWGKLEVSGNESRETAAKRVAYILSQRGSLVYRGKPGIAFETILNLTAKQMARQGAKKITADFSEDFKTLNVS